jgi:hypothetical protein
MPFLAEKVLPKLKTVEPNHSRSEGMKVIGLLL